MSASDHYAPTEGLSRSPPLTKQGTSDTMRLELPRAIGRYRIEQLLGEGGFGLVYLAHDEQLERLVAVKVPHPKRVVGAGDAESYLREARLVAGLDHPHIVPVYDVGSTPEYPCYAVSKFIDGTTLAERMTNRRYQPSEAAELIATLAEALHYAHQKGLVHRDIKPGNVLIDRQNVAFIADFGLALREEEFEFSEAYVGTPGYMSPEQARGEGHRVDGRSDIFSLGVVFYQLLTGRRPFRGDNSQALRDQITRSDPKPPRQVKDHIPKELERICLRALAKRAADRYTTAKDLADDLRHFLARAPQSAASGASATSSAVITTLAPEPTTAKVFALDSTGQSASVPIRVVPKGLRSFDSHDADFFLDLLPGPRDRTGLPDNIRFWKDRIEETNAEATFTVGLLYGPSGCGKSSLVKAGLLPSLPEEIVPIYVEAAPDETESRLLAALRKRIPILSKCASLTQAITALRRGQCLPAGQKALVVLDQFEQWLHAERADSELVPALRQCDGTHVQCLVLVRDDFYMAVNRFFQWLEVPIAEGHNYALVDLFDIEHAEKVLAAFGRAYGKLAFDGRVTPLQQTFLQQAVAGLSENGKVISVRLSLFAEMMKGRSWIPNSLREVGGTQGVGVTFLEETFSVKSAPPTHRLHEQAARSVLQALLPASGSDIKGQLQPYEKLLQVSGYAGRTQAFQALLDVLVKDVRMIAPTEPESGLDDSAAKYYQLTHDFLVPALRDWLTRKQKQTRRGRAELRLAERTEIWNARREKRQLPSLREYFAIRLLTREKDWSEPQRRMIAAATRHYLFAAAAIALLTLVALGVGWRTWRRNFDQRQTLEARELLARVLGAETPEVPELLIELEPFRNLVTDELQSVVATAPPHSKQSLHARLALLSSDPAQAALLQERSLRSLPGEVMVIRSALGQPASEFFWQALEGDRFSADERFHAAAALAQLADNDERWNTMAGFVADNLCKQDPLLLNGWIEALRPVGGKLVEPLCVAFRDTKRDALERTHAALSLADFAAGDLAQLTQLLIEADAAQFAAILPRLEIQRAEAAKLLKPAATIAPDEAPMPLLSEVDKDTAAARQANAAIGLALLDQPDGLWPLLALRPDRCLRTYLVHRMAPLGVDVRQLVERLAIEPDASSRHAMLLAISRLVPESLPAQPRQSAIESALALYDADSDPGVHAAAEFLLRRWNHAVVTADLHATHPESPRSPKPAWYVDRQGHTMVVIPGPITFEMGPQPDETGHYEHHEKLHLARIGRSFAIASKEVTVEQFKRYHLNHPWDANYTVEPDGPVNNLSWYDAAKYCRWLSDEAGFNEDEMCYPPVEQIKPGMRLADDYLSRPGYRLPTEAEWEYVCRAGAVTSRFFGESEELLAEYAWTFPNSRFRSPERVDSGYRARPVGMLMPNDLGMFDILGNVWEWCHDSYRDYTVYDDGRPTEDAEDLAELGEGQQSRVMRGGSFLYQPRDAKAAYRDNHRPERQAPYLGFRVARTIKP